MKDKKDLKKNTKFKRILILTVAIFVIAAIVLTIILVNKSSKEGGDLASILNSNHYYMKTCEVDKNFKAYGSINEITRNGNTCVTSANGIVNMLTEDTYYYIIKEQKTVTKKSREDAKGNMSLTDSILKDKKILSITEVTLNGEKYNCQEYDNVKIYYIGNVAKYVEIYGKMVEIITYTSEIKTELFDIPSDYTVTESK